MSAGAVTLGDIISVDWSLALDSSTASEARSGRIGQVVQGIADINQCIAIVLRHRRATTRCGQPLSAICAAGLMRRSPWRPIWLEESLKRLISCSRESES
jgi:hypothetical protein